jgi:hypothetical protein
MAFNVSACCPPQPPILHAPALGLLTVQAFSLSSIKLRPTRTDREYTVASPLTPSTNRRTIAVRQSITRRCSVRRCPDSNGAGIWAWSRSKSSLAVTSGCWLTTLRPEATRFQMDRHESAKFAHRSIACGALGGPRRNAKPSPSCRRSGSDLGCCRRSSRLRRPPRGGPDFAGPPGCDSTNELDPASRRPAEVAVCFRL